MITARFTLRTGSVMTIAIARKHVLRGVLARTLPAPTLARIFFATEFTRHLDRSGYIRFRRWRFYAEAGLAKQDVQVSIYTSTRQRLNTRRQSWLFTRWNGRITNASKR